MSIAPYAGGIGVLPSMPESPIDLAKELPKAASFSQLYLYLWSSLPFDDERKLRESKDGLCFNLSSAFEGDDSVAQLQIARFLLKLRQPSSLDRDTKKLSQLIATFEGCVSRLIATNVRGNES